MKRFLSSVIIIKGLIGEQDINHWDGRETTFTRPSSTGGTVILNKVGAWVDALISYGGGANYTGYTIQSAFNAVGSSFSGAVILRPGAWLLTSNLDLSAFPFATLKLMPGAYFSGNYTVTFPGGNKIVTPENFGAKGDGSTNDSTAFSNMASSTPSGGTVEIGAGKNYYLNTAASITFANQVNITGTGTITIGTAVGQRAAIIIDGDYSKLSDFTIVGDHSSFANAAPSSELRRSIQIQADHVTVDNVTFSGGIYPLDFYHGQADAKVSKCTFKNTAINVDTIGTYATQNYCSAISFGHDFMGASVTDNYFYGYGSSIQSGNRVYGLKIANNKAELQGDAAIYVNGYNFTITGNEIVNPYGTGILAVTSGSTITGNTLYTTGAYASTSPGIKVRALEETTGQVADSDGNTAKDNAVANNSIKGSWGTALIQVKPCQIDNAGHRNTVITGNTLTGNDTDPTATTGVYGISMTQGHDNYGSIIASNKIHQVLHGVYITATGTAYYKKMEIHDNEIECQIYPFILTRVVDSNIHDNIALDATGTDSSNKPEPFHLTTCLRNVFHHNVVGQTIAGNMLYVFHEVSGCGYNQYIDNDIKTYLDSYERPVYYRHYILNDATGFVSTKRVRTVTLGGHGTFATGEGSIYFITPSNNFNYNPYAMQFPTGETITIVNLAAGANTITFDSTGLNQAVAQNKRGIFTFDGTAWRLISIVP